MIHIACAADEAYVPHCAAMIHSVLTVNDPASVTFHFLSAPDVARVTQAALSGFVEGMGGTFVAHSGLEPRVSGLPVMDRIPSVMWYRVLLPDLLPAVDRVLYLDADTLAVDDLTALWETDLGDALVGAVTNVFEPGVDAHARAMGVAPGDYFNSGVLLLNLARMREEGAAAALIGIGRDRPLLWPDQDALNLVLGVRRVALDPRWNCMNMLFYDASAAAAVFSAATASAAVRNPGILHFEGGTLAKPWHYLNHHPRRAEYFAHRAGTPWPNVRVEGRTLKNRALRPLSYDTTVRVLKWEMRQRHRLGRL